jgi:hypothetical protein
MQDEKRMGEQYLGLESSIKVGQTKNERRNYFSGHCVLFSLVKVGRVRNLRSGTLHLSTVRPNTDD